VERIGRHDLQVHCEGFEATRAHDRTNPSVSLQPSDHRLSNPPLVSWCIEEYYRDRDGETKRCKPCPSHATCEKGTDLSNIRVEKHHYRFTSNATTVYECLHSRGCEGGNNVKTQCKPGYEGPLW